MLKIVNIHNSGVCSKFYDDDDIVCKSIAVNYQNEKEIKICISGRGKSS